jgi:hypothetical protein
MKPLWRFHPDLQASELEDRLLPVAGSVGGIVLTTGGYVLTNLTPGGSPGSTPIPALFVTTGSGGISSSPSGNTTGIPSFAATGTAGSSGGAGVTNAGSAANDPNAASIPLVTRNTVANDAPNAVPLVGRPSGDRSPVLPAGQFYQGDVPQAAPAPPTSETPGGQSNRSSSQDPVDSSPIRLGGAPPRHPSDVSSHSSETRAGRIR